MTAKPSHYVRQGWCQNAVARSARGREVDPCSPRAVSWDLLGAIHKAHGLISPQYHEAIDKVLTKLNLVYFGFYDTALNSWNDDPNRTQDEVIAVLESVGE